jgi:uncharacterized membrane protein
VYTLTVWQSPDPHAAEQELLPRLERVAGDGAAVVEDAALVSWPLELRKPTTRTLGSLTGPGELWGGFWGVLLGLIFLTPMAGPTFGAAAGAVAGALSDFGVEDDFVMRVREHVMPGTSAVFVLAGSESSDRLTAELEGLGVETIRSELSEEQGRHLREALAEDSLRPIE